MSGVHKRMRRPTGADYVDELWELRKYSLYRCSKFPVRYKKWFTDDIVIFFARAHQYAYEANNINPKTAAEAEERRNCIKKAQRALEQVWPQLELAYDMCGWDKDMSNQKILTSEWLPRIDKCEALLKAIEASDTKRYKHLT